MTNFTRHRLSQLQRDSQRIEAEKLLHNQWAGIYEQIESELQNSLEAKRGILSFDTVFLEPKRKNPWEHWIVGEQFKWLNRNAAFTTQMEQHHWCRVLALPRLPFISDYEERKRRIRSIMMYVHLHLWHGVIAGVVFVDPLRPDTGRFDIADLNFVSVPRAQQMFYIPKYYRSVDPVCTLLDANSSTDYLRQVVADFRFTRRSVTWLWYDQWNFSSERLPPYRWNSLRLFFSELYKNNLVCEYCCEPFTLQNFDLDHIMARSLGYPQTIMNLRPIHSGCNRRKQDKLPADSPFNIPGFVEGPHCTPQLISAFERNESPNWLKVVGDTIGERKIIKLFGLDDL